MRWYSLFILSDDKEAVHFRIKSSSPSFLFIALLQEVHFPSFARILFIHSPRFLTYFALKFACFHANQLIELIALICLTIYFELGLKSLYYELYMILLQ